MSGEEEDDAWGALRRISEEQQQSRNDAERIIKNQVAELREIGRYFAARSSEEEEEQGGDNEAYDRRQEKRATRLFLLDTCNGLWDIQSLSAAIDYVHEKPPPDYYLRLTDNDSPASPGEYTAFDEAIPFEKGSDEWCFVILLAYKPHLQVYDEDSPGTALLRADQSSRDACIENGIVCASCLKPGTELHDNKLLQCSKCKIIRYCCRECQAKDWTEGGHKKRCRAGRLKADPNSDDRSTRRQWYDEMYPCWTFIKHHVYPSYESMIGILDNGLLGPGIDYTKEMHDHFKEVYEYIGKNSFKVYGRELGEYLHSLGGRPAMQSGEFVFTKVINSFPRDGIGSPEIAEVLARRLLSSSWDGVGGWDS